MGRGHQKKGVLLILIFAFAFGLILLGAANAAQKAAPAQAVVESKVTLRPFGLQGPPCDPNDYKPVPNDKKQTVSIYIDGDPNNRIKFDGDDDCVQESASKDGSLTFKVRDLPTDYQLEIDFQTRYDVNGKPHKGPFKSKNPSAKYPVAGRCMMSKPKDSCVFDKHNKIFATGEIFQFTVFLWDEEGNLVFEKDPGVMVIDNP